MAMLAGPRRKQKVINLRAKNSAWSNDSNKFGQKMLEKMGWSEGKGLGAKENGIKEHVIAKYKNDDKGLGYKDKNDQWTKHEDDFNSLLANLSQDSNDKKDLLSGTSLEEKSKTSQSRLHYQKFTRGKDISRYSEKDLANIFGKKCLKKPQQSKQEILEDVKITEQVFTEGGNMNDYFKNKIINRKLTKEITQDVDKAKCKLVIEEEHQYIGFGFKLDNNLPNEDLTIKSIVKVTENVITTSKDVTNSQCLAEIDKEISKKKKKKKKQKDQDTNTELLNSDNANADLNDAECLTEDFTKKNKKKSKKCKIQDDNVETVNGGIENRNINDIKSNSMEKLSEKTKKKSKKGRIQDETINGNIEYADINDNECHVSSKESLSGKSKKNNKKQKMQDQNSETVNRNIKNYQHSTDDLVKETKKRSKKHKINNENSKTIIEVAVTHDEVDDVNKKKKSKKNKKKTIEIDTESESIAYKDACIEPVIKKSKKKK